MIDRKKQILDAAEDLLQTRSFSSFSYQDLSDRLGIRKASIHHHFATKQALGVALTKRFLENRKARLANIEQESGDPWTRLDAYFQYGDEMLEKGRICPTGILQAEFNVLPEPIRAGERQLFSTNIAWLSDVLADGRAKNVMSFSGTPLDQAGLIIAAFQGAIQNGRSSGKAQYHAVIRQLKDSITVKPAL
ncbi:MAG: TetR/AcrR family transcriptional regulator [SAR324 cluster bacterium]|nr:TetR/AcrR family transcriptional regulator [SAR324 cluster bacterium]